MTYSMRDFHRPGRSAMLARNAIAATSHPLATAAALDILKSGGNAFDAAIAAAAVQGVVEPMSTGIGGDCFVLFATKDDATPQGLNGSGRSPAGIDAAQLRTEGHQEVDPQSAHAVTIPGAIAAWATLSADHGALEWARLFEPAIHYATEGFPVMPRVALDWATFGKRLQGAGAAPYLPHGRSPGIGDVVRLPALANTLRHIAANGSDGFYRGAVAEDMITHLNTLGGCQTRADFAAARADYVTPIRGTYRGTDIYELPPNGQGVTALIMLHILAGYDLPAHAPLSADRFHLELEATKLATALRNRYVADPSHSAVPVEAMLAEATAEALRDQIDMARAMEAPTELDLPQQKDTVYITVVDEERNVVSFINSIFHPFGSGLVAPASGVVLHSRGSSFSLVEGHPNELAPEKRPLHTIIPAMAYRNDRPLAALGVVGAHYQAVGQTHLMTNMIDYDMDPQAAIDCPRAFATDGNAELETTIDEEVATALANRGHKVKRTELPWGSAQMIAIDEAAGVLAGATDPRRDGLALGY